MEKCQLKDVKASKDSLTAAVLIHDDGGLDYVFDMSFTDSTKKLSLDNGRFSDGTKPDHDTLRGIVLRYQFLIMDTAEECYRNMLKKEKE